MPFKSERQRKFMFANLPRIARRWAKTYGSKVRRGGGTKRGKR